MSGDAASVVILIDYQNIHLTAHNRFSDELTPRHHTLIHPLNFAHQVMAKRRIMQPHHVPSRLTRVVAYRGLPSNERESNAYRRSQAQRSEWTRDHRVEVIYRPLRYPSSWPDKPAQEKGVDVLLALEAVRLADRGQADFIILATCPLVQMLGHHSESMFE